MVKSLVKPLVGVANSSALHAQSVDLAIPDAGRDRNAAAKRMAFEEMRASLARHAEALISLRESWTYMVAFDALGGQTITPRDGSIWDGARAPSEGERRVAHVDSLAAWGFERPEYANPEARMIGKPAKAYKRMRMHYGNGTHRQFFGEWVQDCRMRAFFAVLGGIDASERSRSPPVFLEMGALDGLRASNTLNFEREGWRGVLIEAFRPNCNKLPRNRASGRTINLCTAICSQIGNVTFQLGHGATGRVVDPSLPARRRSDGSLKYQRIVVPCSPLGSLLRQLRLPRIDFFSLDVEGGEAMVMHTYDWQIPIRVLQFENNVGSRDDLIGLLHSKGYSCIGFNGKDRVCVANATRDWLLGRTQPRRLGLATASRSSQLFEDTVRELQARDQSYTCPPIEPSRNDLV